MVDGCSMSDVEADLKRIDNDIGIITVDDGFVSFRHSAFGLYVDSKHNAEYPKTWSQPSADDDKQTRDLDVFSADITQRAIATILHNLGSRFHAGSIVVNQLKLALRLMDLEKANDVAASLEEWHEDIVQLLRQTNRLVMITYRRENESFILRDAISKVVRRFSEDTFIKVTGLDSIGQSRVRGPQELIEYVFTQLFQNSISANATRILVSVKKDPESPLINCQIEDDGVGLSGLERERIFQFITSAEPGHSGTGLFFVKRVLESCGGAISLDSSGGKGTRFTLRFPMLTD